MRQTQNMLFQPHAALQRAMRAVKVIHKAHVGQHADAIAQPHACVAKFDSAAGRRTTTCLQLY